MALPNTNISVAIVKAELGASTNDVGRLCIHPNINKWSKYKPIASTQISGSNSGEFAIPLYGLSIIPYNNMQLALEAYIRDNGATWEYIRPLSQPQFPARLGDFRGYEHTAQRFYEFEYDNFVEEIYPISFFTIDLSLQLTNNTQLSLQDMRLDDKYFGVMIAKDGVPTIEAYAIHDDVLEYDTSSASLTIPMIQIQEGDYVVCPFVSDSNNIDNITTVQLFETQALKFTFGSGVEVTAWFIRYLGDGYAKYHIEFKNTTNKNVNLGEVRIELRYSDSHWTDPLINPPYEEYEKTWITETIPPFGTLILEPDEPETWLYDTLVHGENGIMRLFASMKPSLESLFYLDNKQGNSPSDWGE